MYVAVLELQSWMGTMTCCFEGEAPANIISKFERIQDLGYSYRIQLDAMLSGRVHSLKPDV